MNKKRLLALLLALVMVIGMVPTVWATDTSDNADGTNVGEATEENALSVYAENQVTQLAATGFTPSAVGTLTNDIEVHLFNYGNNINTITTTHFRSEVAAVEYDSIVEPHSIYNQVFAKMSNLDAEGYPSVSQWGTQYTSWHNTYVGSWKTLFDKSIEAETSYTPLSGSNYTIRHYPIENLRLFTVDKKTGWYSYDSRYNAAVYEHANKSLTAYNYALRPSRFDVIYPRSQGAFLPFNGKITADSGDFIRLTDATGKQAYSSLPSGVSGLSTGYENQGYGNWTGYLIYDKDNLANNPKNLFALNSGVKADMGFGMSVEFQFKMPANGQVNGEDMIYEFQGDDDLVVYIDDKPVLNIAGHHEAIKGTINFNSGDVVVYENAKPYEVSWYRSESSTNSGKLSLDPDMDSASLFGSDWKTNEFKEGTIHTLKVFYMERVGGASNCVMKFNIPVMPRGNVSVEKQVESINPALADDQTYTFTIDASHASEVVSTISYDLYDAASDTTTKNHTVANGGTFQLKDGQKANFDLPDKAEVTFTEHTHEGTSGTTWTKDGAAVSGAVTATVDEANPIAFVCTNTRKTGDLTISKELVGTLPEGVNDTYTINVSIGGTPYTGTGIDSDNNEVTFSSAGQTTLAAGKSITITGIPAGTEYAVTEQSPTSSDPTIYEYASPSYTNNQGTILDGTTINVTVSNKVNYLNGSLTIIKEGISAVDHHNENGTGKEEKQSTIFVITNEAGFYLEVVICGNDEIVIRDLPLGEYTVTEKTDWSWRYDPEDSEGNTQVSQTVTITASGATVTFKNDREKIYWLSGDNFLKNLFNKPTTSTN